MILGYHYVTILLVKMLIWAPFLQLMCTFSFCINPCTHTYNLWFIFVTYFLQVVKMRSWLVLWKNHYHSQLLCICQDQFLLHSAFLPLLTLQMLDHASYHHILLVELFTLVRPSWATIYASQGRNLILHRNSVYC